MFIFSTFRDDGPTSPGLPIRAGSPQWKEGEYDPNQSEALSAR